MSWLRRLKETVGEIKGEPVWEFTGEAFIYDSRYMGRKGERTVDVSGVVRAPNLGEAEKRARDKIPSLATDFTELNQYEKVSDSRVILNSIEEFEMELE